MVDLDPRRTGRQQLAVWALHDLDRRVEHLEHAPPTRHRRLGLVEDLGELGDGLEEAVHEEQEADEGARRETGRRALPHADGHHRADGEHRAHLTRGEQQR